MMVAIVELISSFRTKLAKLCSTVALHRTVREPLGSHRSHQAAYGFVAAKVSSWLEPRVIPLALGRDAGIRDLAPLPDGRILVLAGPAQDQLEVHFALFALDLREGRFTRLATLDDPQGICTPGPRAISGKPEAVLPLGLDEDCFRVLILSDSLPNGAPCEYRVPRQ